MALHDGRIRRRRRQFLVEGTHAVSEALAADVAVLEVFVADATHEVAALAAAADVAVRRIDYDAMEALSATVHPQGIVAVVATPDTALDDAVSSQSSLVVVLIDIRDPGNAGTIVRTADAAGVDAVVFAGDCVDPYNPKVVRASVGSLFHLPVVISRDVTAVSGSLRDAGLDLLATRADGSRDLFDDVTAQLLRGRIAWVFGNEAHGLDEAVVADHAVRISMPGRAESLNLGVAASICMYATVAARR